MKGTYVRARVTQEQKTFIYQFCKSLNLNVSKFLIDLAMNEIQKNPISDKQKQKISKILLQENTLKAERERHKRFMHNQYFIHNTLMQLHRVSRAGLVNTDGEKVNCAQIKNVLESAKKIYNSFPLSDRKIFAEDYKELTKWENMQYAIGKVQYLNAIKRGESSVEKRKEIELHKNKDGEYEQK